METATFLTKLVEAGVLYVSPNAQEEKVRAASGLTLPGVKLQVPERIYPSSNLTEGVVLRMISVLSPEMKRPDLVVGVPTGAITLAALIATHLRAGVIQAEAWEEHGEKGFAIKKEATTQLVGNNVLIVEDVCTTGSSAAMLAALVQRHGGEILGCVSAFSWGLFEMYQKLSQAGIQHVSAFRARAVVRAAYAEGLLTEEHFDVIMEWIDSPY